MANVATVPGSIPVLADTVDFEGRLMIVLNNVHRKILGQKDCETILTGKKKYCVPALYNHHLTGER
jgi:hypothetical protein